MFDQHVEAFKKAAVDDILMGENPLASYINDLPVELLPCQIPFLNQVQCHKWLEKEIKKDYIEMGIGPVACIPWGKVESLYHWIFFCILKFYLC